MWTVSGVTVEAVVPRAAIRSPLEFTGILQFFRKREHREARSRWAGRPHKVPAGGGAPAVWFADPALAGNPNIPFGVNGIRIDKSNRYVTCRSPLTLSLTGRSTGCR